VKGGEQKKEDATNLTIFLSTIYTLEKRRNLEEMRREKEKEKGSRVPLILSRKA